MTEKKTMLRVTCAAFIMLALSMSCLAAEAESVWHKNYSSLAEYEDATGQSIDKFSESPGLSKLVQQGILPKVEDRLPVRDDICVIDPPSIGEFGGVLRGAAIDPSTWNDTVYCRMERFLQTNNDYTTTEANVPKGWELSPDGKEITLFLREGMRWSDGHPFTADDIVFWWEDEMLNKELTPVVPARWAPGGVPMEVHKIDDYTVKLSFANPYPAVVNVLTIVKQGNFYDPAHYLKQFHPKYAPAEELEAGIQKEGYSYWYELFQAKKSDGPEGQNTELPVVGPWVLASRTLTRKVFERNPYYWKVDSAGNQLPYIDRLETEIVGNLEVLNMKAVAGDLDFAAMDLVLSNYPLLRENEANGGYRVVLGKSTRGSDVALAFNLNHKDPILREVFQDVRFRRAMSMAIDRHEINELIFFGLGTPRQATVIPNASFYEESWGTAYAQYDPKTAEGLLDDMGLTRGADGIRTRSDGKPLELTIEYWHGEGPKTDVLELVKMHWEKLGIRVALKAQERNLYSVRANAAEHDVGSWHLDRTMEGRLYGQPDRFHPPGLELAWGVQWAQWRNTEGESGVEPPEEIKELYRWLDKWATALDDETYQEAAKNIFQIHADNLYTIGTVGLSPMPFVVRDNLCNVPSDTDLWLGTDNGWMVPLDSEIWFYE